MSWWSSGAGATEVLAGMGYAETSPVPSLVQWSSPVFGG
jgi:hypothetical protein